ncbi:sensor histidine kinase [Devosia sp. ZB163]|uniref:sensor histidine kinase n=1 Tax=Devosia sp. ZB163 TaxID=3025938 RepID=UPI00235F4D09|nr:sensor histidine kinase [Devosia sp. ZB163]MDC9822562.1 sensor histidine kinase [Devosia sp. ZB163]
MADGSGSAETGASKRTRVARPIAVYLFVLALVALVPAFIFSAVLLQRNNEAQERVVETLITGNARAIVQAVDREINANVTTLRVLATTPPLEPADYPAFHARVSQALADTGSYVYLIHPDFTSDLSTRVPISEQKVTPIGDVETAKKAFETHEVVVSDAVFGRVSQQWVVNILLPIFPPGNEPLILGFSRSASQLSMPLLASRMPEGWHVALVDRKGVMIATTGDGGATGDAFNLLPLDQLGSAAGWRNVRDGNTDYLVVTQQSLLTGWTLVAWADRNVVAQPLADAFWSLLAGGVLLAALVVLVVYGVSLQIGRSVHGLEADAKRLGAGQPVEARHFPIEEIETVSAALGDASRRRQAAETEVRFLMRELAHRSKNQMTVIAAMAKQTARGADTVPEFVQSFERRIFGLARSTDLLLAHGVAGVDLKELMVSQIDPFCPVDGKQVVVEGPALRLNAQAAQILGMAAHELATNAAKYGAFAREGGRLSVTWKREGEAVAFTWHETGSTPGVIQPRRGFGTTVLENMVGRSLNGEVNREVHERGITWRFTIPLASLDPSDTLNGRAEA